jgi:hypothetical protein
MGSEIKKKTVIPLITSLGFIAISINSLFKGIDHHETWQPILAATAGLFFVALSVMLVHNVYTNKREGSKA